MKGIAYERVKHALEAVLGTEISGWNRTITWRDVGPQEFFEKGSGWVRIDVYGHETLTRRIKAYTVLLRRGKSVTVDLENLLFLAPRWGYVDWTPIFQHARFFTDVHATGHDLLERNSGEGERRQTIESYISFRRSLYWAGNLRWKGSGG
jgi:hypothetical protein